MQVKSFLACMIHMQSYAHALKCMQCLITTP